MKYTSISTDCSVIHSKCQQCTAEGSTSCTGCASGWYVSGGTCAGMSYTQ